MAAKGFSFDIVSKVDITELDNALNQARREIDNRFDFKGTGTRIESGKSTVAVFSSDEFHLKAAIEVLETRAVRRGLDLKAIAWGPVVPGPKGSVKREARIIEGIDQDTARAINRFIRKLDKRVNVAVQQEQIRVTSKSKDSLQGIIKAVREHDFGIPLQFTNYR